MKQIDVDAIMKEIREEISREREMAGIPDFDADNRSSAQILYGNMPSALNGVPVNRSIEYINGNYNVLWYTKYTGGKLRVLFYRVVRKLIGGVMYPLVQKQNQFNIHVVNCINGLVRANSGIKELREENRELREEIYELKKELQELRGGAADR